MTAAVTNATMTLFLLGMATLLESIPIDFIVPPFDCFANLSQSELGTRARCGNLVTVCSCGQSRRSQLRILSLSIHNLLCQRQLPQKARSLLSCSSRCGSLF